MSTVAKCLVTVAWLVVGMVVVMEVVVVVGMVVVVVVVVVVVSCNLTHPAGLLWASVVIEMVLVLLLLLLLCPGHLAVSRVLPWKIASLAATSWSRCIRRRTAGDRRRRTAGTAGGSSWGFWVYVGQRLVGARGSGAGRVGDGQVMGGVGVADFPALTPCPSPTTHLLGTAP